VVVVSKSEMLKDREGWNIFILGGDDCCCVLGTALVPAAEAKTGNFGIFHTLTTLSSLERWYGTQLSSHKNQSGF
jgi:hypothetical protein